MTHRDTSSSPSRPHDTPLQLFGATLRQYRQQRRLSQPALSTRTGIRHRYISQIEQGRRNISVLMLLRLAQALEIPAACLLAQLDAHATLAPPVTGEPLTPRQTLEVVGSAEDSPPLLRDDPATLLRLLGATLRQSRHTQALSQPALAASTGLTVGYISEIEQGQRNLSVLSLVRIADALGLSVAPLLAPLETRSSPSPPRTR